jgi:hypothetical protein
MVLTCIMTECIAEMLWRAFPRARRPFVCIAKNVYGGKYRFGKCCIVAFFNFLLFLFGISYEVYCKYAKSWTYRTKVLKWPLYMRNGGYDASDNSSRVSTICFSPFKRKHYLLPTFTSAQLRIIVSILLSSMVELPELV